MKKISRIAALFATAAFAASCGSDSAGTTDAADEAATDVVTTEAEATDAEATDVVIDLEGRTITVAIENAYLPFNYIDAATGEPGGWDYAALSEICERINCVVEYKTVAWDGMIQAVADGQYDVAADGITITEDRAKVVDFSDGYINVDQRILVAIDSEITGAEDLKSSDCEVGAQVGSTNHQVAVSLVGDDRVRTFDEFALVVQAVISGDICATLVDETAGQGYVGEQGDKIHLVGGSQSADELGFVFPKGSDLVGPFNHAISEMKTDGTMEKLGTEYFSGAFTITYDDITE